MSMDQLRGVLKRAAALFDAGGARTQATNLEAVERLLADSGDQSVDDFVDRTVAAMNAPKPADMEPAQIVAALNEIGTDRNRFNQLVAQLKVPAFNKAKATATASLFTGAKPTAWRSKPQALEAIRQKFEERVYLAAKAAANANVTPW